MGSRRREKDTPRLAAGGVLAVALVVGVILLLGRGGGPPGEAEREHQEGPQHAVSEKKANPWGLFDVHGNVGEWCEDHWVHTYSGAPSDGSAWTEEAAPFRVCRGGGWTGTAQWCRCASRMRLDPGRRVFSLGFRPAASLP